MNKKGNAILSAITPMLWLCFALIVLAVLSRLAPHPSNVTPIGALGLFAGACLPTRKFWLVPLAALLISDALIGFYHPLVMTGVYLGFVLIAMLGRMVLMQRRSVLRLAATSLSASVIFFIVSNFGVWLSGLDYPLTVTGLLEAYAMAIPFFGNTLMGDLFYVALLFGAYETARVWLSRSHAVRTS